MAKDDRRAYPRIEARLPIRAQTDPESGFHGMVIDISRVGLTAVFPSRDVRPVLDDEGNFAPTSVDVVLGLKLEAGEAAALRCRCRAVHHGKRADGDFRLGLEFTTFEDDGEAMLEEFVAQSLRYEDPPG
jgi:hypothetical protein